MTTPLRITLVPAVVLAVTGCFTPAKPRVADVNRRGDVSIIVTLPFAGFAPGRLAGASAGNTVGAVPSPGFIGTLFGLMGTEVDVAMGVGHGCELGVIAGVNRLGGEVRCSLRDERDGDALSVAPFVRGGYQPGPAFAPRGPWLATGIDLSRGREPAVAFSPTLSYGAEAHSVALPPGPGLEQENFLTIGRREWRVSFPIGVAASPRSSARRGGRVILGVIPYWTFAHGTPTSSDFGTKDKTGSVAGFGEDWGFVVTIGGGSIPLP